MKMKTKEKKVNKKEKKSITALVPGSFDPITIGHVFLIDHAAKKYGKVYVTIFINDGKTYEFSEAERLEMLESVCADKANVTVESDHGMLYEYARKKGVTVSVRGYRNESDLSYEKEMAAFNKRALPSLDTEILPCPPELSSVRSTAVREALSEQKDISAMVPPEAYPTILRHISAKK